MKAMVLAAGIGSRLRPLTDRTPKALIEVGGTPMLELVLQRLVRAGADAVIVNAFHLAGQVEDFLRGRDFGARVEVSRETELLDTGGGLRLASWFFADGKPFFLHNADVLSDIDLCGMYRAHLAGGALATLAVSERPSARRFFFDERGLLCGWGCVGEDREHWAWGPPARTLPLAFNGIHVVSPEIFPMMTETGAFPISRVYLRLAGAGAAIRAFRTDGSYYKDIGSEAKLAEARRHAANKGLAL